VKSYVVPLDGSLPGRSEVGGKAVGLAAPTAAGFPVPSALCITVQAFHLALAPYSAAIKRASCESADGSDDASQEISGMVHILLATRPPLAWDTSTDAATTSILPPICTPGIGGSGKTPSTTSIAVSSRKRGKPPGFIGDRK
jgi:hypothetical protein